MSTQDLKAGIRCVERRFEIIAREFGAPRTLAQEDRWREISPPPSHQNQSMTYYIELDGHLKRGEIHFWGVDLEIAGTGEPAAQDKLGRHIREALVSSSERRN